MTTTHRITTAIALALALGASAAPASAFPTNINANGTEVPAIPTSTQATQLSRPVATPATIVRVSAPSGFDWGDAGIGAAGGIAVSMIGLGGALAVSTRRTRRTRHATALTS